MRYMNKTRLLSYERLAKLDMEGDLWGAYLKKRIKLSDIAYYARECMKKGLHDASSHYFLSLAVHFFDHGEMEMSLGFEKQGISELEKALKFVN